VGGAELFIQIEIDEIEIEVYHFDPDSNAEKSARKLCGL
jgi:hypothetical protein